MNGTVLVWLLILSAGGSGKAITTVQLADADSCERAGKRFISNYSSTFGGGGTYVCTQVRVPRARS